MTDIFREVEEDLRREKYQDLWEKYGFYLIAAAVLVVLGASAWAGWNAYSLSTAETASEAYAAAVDEAGGMAATDAAVHFEQSAANLQAGYRDLARLRQAASLVAAGEKAAAISLYDAIGADADIDPTLRGLASVKAGILLLDRASFDDLHGRLAAMTGPAEPWRNTARELLGFAAYKAGDLAKAKQWFDEIIGDPVAPPGSRDRANVMLAVMAPELAETANTDAERANEPSEPAVPAADEP